MYQKARPDKHRLVDIDSTLVHTLGGIEKRAPTLLVASWLAGGVAFNDKIVPTPSGKVTIPTGHVWGSLLSAQEDLLAATGQRFSYGAVRNAVKVLGRSGFITQRYDPLPQTRGAYGTVFALDPDVFNPSLPVSPLRLYRTMIYGDPADYRYGEIVTGELGRGGRRGRYGRVHQWINTLSQEGFNLPAFTTIGRWKYGESGKADSSVYIPYFTIDIDRVNVYDAWEDAINLCKTLEGEGFDAERVYVSFSGRRGFHIQISADQIGSPLFKDAEAAKIVCEDFSAMLTEGIQVDPSVNSPLSLIRVSGSRHEDTGLFKATFTMTEFLNTDYETVMKAAATGRPFEFPLPHVGETVPDPFDAFDSLQAASEERYVEVRALAKRDYTGPTNTVKALIGGLAEGEVWHDRHSGRNKAAFILACFLLGDRGTNDMAIDQVRLESGAWAALQVWNGRNDPPLPERELWQSYSSASRRILGTRPNPSER